VEVRDAHPGILSADVLGGRERGNSFIEAIQPPSIRHDAAYDRRAELTRRMCLSDLQPALEECIASARQRHVRRVAEPRAGRWGGPTEWLKKAVRRSFRNPR